MGKKNLQDKITRKDIEAAAPIDAMFADMLESKEGNVIMDVMKDIFSNDEVLKHLVTIISQQKILLINQKKIVTLIKRG